MHETNMIRRRHDDKQGNNNYLLRKLAFKVFFANRVGVIIRSFETNIKFEVMKDTAYTAYCILYAGCVDEFLTCYICPASSGPPEFLPGEAPASCPLI